MVERHKKKFIQPAAGEILRRVFFKGQKTEDRVIKSSKPDATPGLEADDLLRCKLPSYSPKPK